MSVEPAASGDRAYMVGLSGNINLPYASDIANAASNTNTGVPGKYVVDMNGKYSMLFLITVQCKYFEGYKFRRFRCFPTKHENYFRENEQMPIVTWLNYACNPQN